MKNQKKQGKKWYLTWLKACMGIISHVHFFFFTSCALDEELLKRKVTMLGTVRRNKPELSSERLAVKNRKVTSLVFSFTEKATLVSYCPKEMNNVLLLSTKMLP